MRLYACMLVLLIQYSLFIRAWSISVAQMRGSGDKEGCDDRRHGQ